MQNTQAINVKAGSAVATGSVTVSDSMPGVPCPDPAGYKYVGARYVPLFAEPAEWNINSTYEPLTIVLNEGNSYTSKQYVPVGIQIDNKEYWALTGNFNAQLEMYRQEQLKLSSKVTFGCSDVAVLKNNTYFSVGDIVRTEGFHEPGDGGSAQYEIVSDAVSNEMDIIKTYNGYAVLQPQGFTLFPEQFGAYGDGTHDDTLSINRMLEYAVNKYPAPSSSTESYPCYEVKTSDKTYLVNNVQLPRYLKADFGKSVFITSQTGVYAFAGSLYQAVLTGGIFACNYGLDLDNNNLEAGNVLIEQSEFRGSEIAVSVNLQSTNFNVKNCKFDNVQKMLVQTSCDNAIYESNWCSAKYPKSENEANIDVKGGKAVFDSNIFIPYGEITPSINTEWINVETRCIAVNNRFSGETGARTAVYLNSKYNYSQYASLILKNNLTMCSTGDKSIVRLGDVPNTLIVTDNYGAPAINNYVAIDKNSNFNSTVNSLFNTYTNGNYADNIFFNTRIYPFNFNISNNNASGTILEDDNSWKFISDGYMFDDDKEKWFTTSSSGRYQHLDLVDNVVKLPIALLRHKYHITVTFDPNTSASAFYRTFYDFIFGITKYYDGSEIQEKYEVNNIITPNYSSFGSIEAGLWDNNGAYFDSRTYNQGYFIALKFTGISPGSVYIKCVKVS